MVKLEIYKILKYKIQCGQLQTDLVIRLVADIFTLLAISRHPVEIKFRKQNCRQTLPISL